MMTSTPDSYDPQDSAQKPSLWMSILLTALTSMGVLSVTFYVPSMLAIAEDFQVEKAAVQITLSVFLFGFSFGQLIYGPLSDQFGRRVVLLIGLISYTISSAICALAYDIEALQLARGLQGFSACCGAVISRAVIRDLFHQDQAVKIYAFIATALSLTPALAPILGSQIQVWLGWRSCFWFLSFVGLAMFIWSWVYLKESNQSKLAGAIHPVRLAKIYFSLLSNIHFVALVLIGSFLFCGLMSYTTISPFLMLEELGLNPDEYGLLIMFTAVSYGAGSFLSGRFVGKVGFNFILTLGPMIALAGAVLMLYWGDQLSVVHLVLPASIYLFGNGMVIPPTMALAMKPFAHVAGSASAMMGAFQMGTAGIVSYLVNDIYDKTAAPLAYVMIGLAILSFMSYLCVKYISQKQNSDFKA